MLKYIFEWMCFKIVVVLNGLNGSLMKVIVTSFLVFAIMLQSVRQLAEHDVQSVVWNIVGSVDHISVEACAHI